MQVEVQNLYYDVEIAAYILNPTATNKKIEDIIEKYLKINQEDYEKEKPETEQMNLFDSMKEKSEETNKEKNGLYAYSIKEV